MADQDFGTIDLTHVKGDPTVAQAADPGAFDPLDALAAELAHAVPVPTVTVPVEHRPGWAVKYRLNIAWTELQQWRKQATDRGRIDQAYLSRLILANACIGFVKDGSEVVNGDGVAVTFGTVAKQKGGSVADAVRAWLVTDGAIEGTSNVVYLRAGYGGLPVAEEGTGDGEDPTQG